MRWERLDPAHPGGRARSTRRAHVPPGRDAGLGPVGQARAVRPLPDRDLRRVGATRRGHGLRPDLRGGAAQLAGLPSSGMCVFKETCGPGLALEHNGDLYACDHFVEPDYLLGNIMDTPMVELVRSPQQLTFGQAKATPCPDVPRVRRALRLPRGMPQEPPRGRPELPVRGLQGVLPSRGISDEAHGRAVAPRP